jgi:hypothetical protein
MRLEYVRLLATQRDLYRIPRGPERFQEYLRTMIDPDTRELRLPLGAMSPMAREPVSEFLDGLVSVDAEEAGARATEEAAASLAEEPGAYRVGLVVADDAEGGWTNRAATELTHRRGEPALEQRGWITGILWASETYGPAEVREEVLTSIYRQAHIARRGPASTLRDLLVQEGNAMRTAGARNPVLEPHALVQARLTLRPLLDRQDRATFIAALFGDAAALELGHPPLGLPPRAGLAVALHGRLETRRKRPSRDDPSHRPSS